MSDNKDNKDNKTSLPAAPASRSQDIDIYRLPQKESNPPVFEGFQTWSDRVQVTSFAFDHLGHLWGCGRGGVVRWIISPNEIKYKVWQSEHGIAGNDTGSMFIASDGRIICGHSSGWISILENDTWHNIDTHTKFPISAISETSAGNILACTDVGLFDVDLETIDRNIPAPPLCATSAFGYLWIGTESGLYFREDDKWQFLEIQKPFRVVTSMKVSNNKLWFCGFSGAGYIDESGDVHRIQIKEPVRDVAPIGDQAFLATESGVYIYTESTKELRRTSPHAANAIVSSGHQLVQTTDDNVLLIDYQRKEKRWLFPDASNTPGEIQSVHDVDGVTYIQCIDNSIWYENKVGWTKLLDKTLLPITSIAKFKDHIFVSFMANRGLARILDGKLNYEEGLSYVRGMEKQENQLWIASLYRIHVLDYSTDEIQTLSLGNAPGLQSCCAIFTAINLRDVLFLTKNELYGIEPDGSIKVIYHCKDPVQQWHFNEDDLTLTIYSSSTLKRIQLNSINAEEITHELMDVTALVQLANTTLIGTHNGLLNANVGKLLNSINSGISHSRINSATMKGNKIFLSTFSGVTVVSKEVLAE